MTWVKLCGMQTEGDVAAAVDAGADAVGFVTAAGSLRRVSPQQAAVMGDGAPLERFLVTLDLTPEALLRDATAARVTGVQPHGRHARAAARAALMEGFRVLLPVDMIAGADPADVPEDMMPILDGRAPGSGVAFDWSQVAVVTRRYVLAGGLTPGNVADAVAALSPYGVDVSSGIETEPGVKDHELMRRFVEAVR